MLIDVDRHIDQVQEAYGRAEFRDEAALTVARRGCFIGIDG